MLEILSMKDQPNQQSQPRNQSEKNHNGTRGRLHQASAEDPNQHSDNMNTTRTYDHGMSALEAARVIVNRQEKPTSERVDELNASIRSLVLSRSQRGDSSHHSRQDDRREETPFVGAQFVSAAHDHDNRTSYQSSNRIGSNTNSNAARVRTHHRQLLARPATAEEARSRHALASKDQRPSTRLGKTIRSGAPARPRLPVGARSTEHASNGSRNNDMGGQETQGSLPLSNDTTVELYGGKTVRVRGTKHTWRDIARGRATIVQCPACSAVLQIGAKVKLLYCSQCGEISPLDRTVQPPSTVPATNTGCPNRHNSSHPSSRTRPGAVPSSGPSSLSANRRGMTDNDIAQVVQQQEMDVAIAKKLAEMQS